MNGMHWIRLALVGSLVVRSILKERAELKKYAARLAEREASWGEWTVAQDEEDLERKSAGLLQLMAKFLGVAEEKLTPNLSFQYDLRVPPGEVRDLVDAIEERYGIRIDAEKVRSVKDILNVVRLEKSRVGID